MLFFIKLDMEKSRLFTFNSLSKVPLLVSNPSSSIFYYNKYIYYNRKLKMKGSRQEEVPYSSY